MELHIAKTNIILLDVLKQYVRFILQTGKKFHSMSEIFGKIMV